MPDFLGNIEVPEIVPAGTFPLVSDFGFGRTHAPQVVEHQFGSANAKITQRFYLGNGAKRFTVLRRHMREADRTALRDFWELRKGGYGSFTYNAPNEDGNGTTAFTVRFANEPISWEWITNAVSTVGLTLIEVPTTNPSYTLNSTVTRFPSATLATGLLPQVQTMIPLLKITATEAGYPAIFLSDRRATVGGQLYQARLLEFNGISQELGGAEDDASFTFGNADSVMRDLANDTDLYLADIEFSLFHVATGIKLDLWKGQLTDWRGAETPEFGISASDGADLNLSYPRRRISRTCWKPFNVTGVCPFAAEGALDLVHFPLANASVCDKGYDTANGCLAHGMKVHHGGIVAEPQAVRIKDNSTGTWGYGRSPVTSTSLVADSIYDQVLPEVYTDSPMPVPCKIAAGRDESDFYDALGIVGEGPLGAYGTGHKLDGQFHHGYPGSLGLRTALGSDPAGATHFFSLGQSGNQTGGDFRKVFSGNSTYKDNFSAGVAFLELRRSDEKGIQQTRLSEHSMEAVVSQGLSGYTWTGAVGGPYTRNTAVLTNPAWIAVNMLLRARGLQLASESVQRLYFDVDAAIAAASVCDQTVTKLVGTGAETQFKFRGVVQEEKPLRDWLTEVLMNCLGYFTFAFGRLRIGAKINSSTVEAFTVGNVLFQSLELTPLKPTFNHLTAIFADEEFEYVGNSVQVYDIDHALQIAQSSIPEYRKSNLNLAGTSSKSQAARIVSTRLREELGGTSAAERKAARHIAFRTTVLALGVDPGMVCSMTHAEMPGGAGEFRVTGWRLNPDYSIDITGRTTTDSMYDLTTGPKPADVVADPVPTEGLARALREIWHPNQVFPHASDPMFDENDGTFAIAQTTVTQGDGMPQVAVKATGKQAVNLAIADSQPPQIGSLTTSATGGSILGAKLYYIGLCAENSEGKLTPMSNIQAIEVGGATNTNQLILGSIKWPAGTYSGYVVFGADDPRMMCKQVRVVGALPGSITMTAAFVRSTWNAPNPNTSHVRVKAKREIHAGRVGALVTAVDATSITCSDLVDPTDNWNGSILSVIADASGGAPGVWNFQITAYNAATGKCTVTPDPSSAGVEVGDVAIVRSQATSATSTTVTDTKLANKAAPTGLAVNAEIGNIIRILAGTGRGQARRIVSNTGTQVTIETPWGTTPDSTSVLIWEAPAWEHMAESSPTRNALSTVETAITMPVANLVDKAVLVIAVLVDRNTYIESSEEISPMREMWLFGEFGSIKERIVTITSNYTMLPEDRVVLGDTSAGNIVVTLTAASLADGETRTFRKITGDANTMTVNANAADNIDGLASFVLTASNRSRAIKGEA